MGTEKLLFRLEQPHGTGDIYITFQKGSGNYLATTGIDSMVNIFDRYGQIQDRIRLPGLCTGFDWDSDGDLLGIICQSPQLILWDANSQKKITIDVRLKDSMSCLIWAKTGPLLAIGTSKGNVSIYDHNTSKRVPIIGKHSKKITCGAWNKDNLLALGSDDKTISISSSEGDTLRIVTLRAEPSDLQFSEMKLDENTGGENTVSLIVGKRTLYLYNLLDPENPVELAFQQHYGAIVSYKWYGDGYILIGFSAGYFISISTHIKEVGQELFQVKNHKNTLTDIAICEAIGKAASCGDNNIKIHNLANLQETSSVLTLTSESALERIGWSVDGQILAVCTKGGSLNVYVSNMALLSSVYATRIAILSSLTEVSLYNYSPDKTKIKPLNISLETEPSFLAAGPFHIAVGLNNRIWFYDLTRPGGEDFPFKLKDRQYLGNITSVKLNQEYAAVLFEGKIQLHMIEQPEVCEEFRETIMFPAANENHVITSHSMTTDFLIFATDMGQIIYYHIEEWNRSGYYQHDVGITHIYPDPPGTRLFFLDIKSKGFVYNGYLDEIISVPDLPNKIDGAIWDCNIEDRDIFIVFNEQEIVTYIYTRLSIYGSSVKKIGVTNLASKQMPLLMYEGEVMSATSGGQLTQITLATHDYQKSLMSKETIALELDFDKQLALHRFKAAVQTCVTLNDKKYWQKLIDELVVHLEIEIAMEVAKRIDDISTVFALESLLYVEDHRLLSGYISMFLNEFDRAQEWFLKSSHPNAALEMRRDLLQWNEALELAKKMAPDQVTAISREYAQQLEFMGNQSEAYILYEKASKDNLNRDHIFACKSGMARTSLHLKNFKHGINLALELSNKQLFEECAEILEKNNQLGDAGLLYEKCENFEKAAIIYIKLKQWMKIGQLLNSISNDKIVLQYAAAKEEEGDYQEAVKAYNNANDFDSVIRLQLEKLGNPEIAVELVQETKSIEGAKMVAKFFQELNDYNAAIQFLVLSHCTNEAHDLALKHGKMELYGEVLLNSLPEDEVRPQDFANIAMYFEKENDNLLAGKYWFHAREYNKALKRLLKAAKSNSKENEAISFAIDAVASSKNETLSNELIEFLLGESDGLPKDPKHLFRLYMAKKQYKEASKSAVIIANEEQINGNYRNAHDVLFAMCQELKQNGIKIPQEMYQNLILLHSYILARMHVRRGDHLKAARMLIRVADNISKFPSHIVPILTSTVIECHRANLKQAAFQYATMLITNSEYRKQIEARFIKKIEGCVRKPPKNLTDPPEAVSPCPFCEKMITESDLFCNSCKNNIPFCIVTGRHLEANDLTVCPECDFPALRTPFIEILDSEDSCPMCSEKVDSRRLVKIEEIRPYLSIE